MKLVKINTKEELLAKYSVSTNGVINAFPPNKGTHCIIPEMFYCLGTVIFLTDKNKIINGKAKGCTFNEVDFIEFPKTRLVTILYYE